MNNTTNVPVIITRETGIGVPAILGIVFALVCVIIFVMLYAFKEITDAGGIESCMADLRSIKNPFNQDHIHHTDQQYATLTEALTPDPTPLDDDLFKEQTLTDFNDINQVLQSAVIAEKRRSRMIEENARPLSHYAVPFGQHKGPAPPLPGYAQLMGHSNPSHKNVNGETETPF